MILNIQKFNKEIQSLKSLKRQRLLHPFLKAQLKERILSEIKQGQSPAVSSSRLLAVQTPRVWRYAAPIAFGALLCASTVFASNNATLTNPLLYSVKQVRENLELRLAPTAKAKAVIVAKHAQARLIELAEIKSQRHQSPKLEVQAESNARTAVALAINNLDSVKQQLQAQGDDRDAADLDDNITKLSKGAKAAHILMNKPN